jgi:hypothetical protein
MFALRRAASPAPFSSRLAASAALLCATLAITACSGGGGGGAVVSLASIDVEAVGTTAIPRTLTRAFRATGHYSNGATLDLTATAAWSVADPTVAAIVSSGIVKGLLPGATQVRATAFGVQSNALDVTVVAAAPVAVAVAPGGATLAAGTRMQYGAIAIWSDGSWQDVTGSATWAAVPGTLATFPSAGVALGGTAGTGTIQATFAGVTGSAAVTVTNATLSSIAVTPALPLRPVGVPVAFTATGTFYDPATSTTTAQDLTLDVVWASSTIGSSATVATISPTGVATPVAPGAAAVTATRGAVSGSTILHVSAATLAALEVTPSTARVTPGTGVHLAALGHFSDGSTQELTAEAAWAATPGTIATVTQGLVTGISAGGATITASYGGMTQSAVVTVAAATLVSIAVAPASPTVPVGVDQPFTATGTFSDLSTQDLTALAAWTSSVTTVAAVSSAPGSEGVATAIAVGSATIAASYAGVTGSTTMAVAASTLSSIDVQPATTVIVAGAAVQYIATGHYAGGATRDLTRDVTWSSSGAAASISNAAGSQGLARGVSAGTVTIRASLGTVASTGRTLQVLAPVLVRADLSPASVSLAKGETQAFTLTGTYSDGSTTDLTGTAVWITLDPTVATNTGNLVRAVGTSGSTQVHASFSGLTASADVSVGPPVVVEVTLSPAAYSLASGTSVQYDAAAIWSDGVKQDVTATALWAATPAAIATITATGYVTGLATGAATVSATALGVTGSTPLTVTPATLSSLSISPTDPSVPNGLPQPFTAIGVFSDGTLEDLTDQVSWDSSNPGVAWFDASGATSGVASTLDPIGTATVVVTITATRGAISASTSLTITKAVLCTGVEPLCTSGVGGVSVDQSSATIAAGTSFPFTASGAYTDGSVVDITALSLWSSDAVAVATVSNAAGNEGLATGLGQGTANITAAFGGQSDFSPLTVTTAVLTSVAISLPPGGSATVPMGMTQPLVATATFSDGSTQDLTAFAGWSSSVPTCAAVSNAPGTEGLVTGVAPGVATITAAYQGLSGTLTITVSSATVTSIDVTSATSTVPIGWTIRYAATAHYTDSSTRDVTAQATWLSSNGAIATVSNAAGTQGLATAVSAGTASISATLSGKTGSAPIHAVSATLLSIAVTPNPFSVALRGTVQLTATGTFSNGVGAFDVTRQCQWSASPKKAATVRGGLVTGVKHGGVTVTAKKGPVRGSASGTVN